MDCYHGRVSSCLLSLGLFSRFTWPCFIKPIHGAILISVNTATQPHTGKNTATRPHTETETTSCIDEVAACSHPHLPTPMGSCKSDSSSVAGVPASYAR
ncbi:hypothetical protein RRG08_053289 [Elysia crispata]|uniref:Uncharacterized protein n=1 Tax=Elysia crispata TaxID=231223 RepID=A0AAE0Z6A7_9GAST|nr:hypothetical protein RRG08_053289 [Elysia crispata]